MTESPSTSSLLLIQQGLEKAEAWFLNRMSCALASRRFAQLLSAAETTENGGEPLASFAGGLVVQQRSHRILVSFVRSDAAGVLVGAERRGVTRSASVVFLNLSQPVLDQVAASEEAHVLSKVLLRESLQSHFAALAERTTLPPEKRAQARRVLDNLAVDKGRKPYRKASCAASERPFASSPASAY